MKFFEKKDLHTRLKMKKISQKKFIYEMISLCGKVNSYDLTFKYGIKQAPTRVHELNDLHFQFFKYKIIVSKRSDRDDRSTDYSFNPLYLEEKNNAYNKRGEVLSTCCDGLLIDNDGDFVCGEMQ